MYPVQFGGLPGGLDLSLGAAVAVPLVVALALNLDARGRDTDHPLAFGVAALLGGLLGTVPSDPTSRVAVGVGVPVLVAGLYFTVRDELEESAPPVVGSGDVDTGDMVLGETVGPGGVADDASDDGAPGGSVDDAAGPGGPSATEPDQGVAASDDDGRVSAAGDSPATPEGGSGSGDDSTDDFDWADDGDDDRDR